MTKKISSRLMVVAAGMALALGAGVMGAAPASAAQAGAIANPACGTNTYIIINTNTIGTTTHYYNSTSGESLNWPKGIFATPTDSSTPTKRSTAQTISGSASSTFNTIGYKCG